MFELFRTHKKNYSVGDKLFLGKYPKDSTPIEWRVLNVFDSYALLISEYAIIPSAYCNPAEGLKGVEWINSLARKVCNDEFYNTAFTTHEKQIICKKVIKQLSISNPEQSLVCDDNVFILSEQEALLYLSDSSIRTARPTEYVSAVTGLQTKCYFNGYIPWWLLPQYEIGGIVTDTSGVQYPAMIYPKVVDHQGKINYHGRNAYHSDFAIRPCIQINLKAYEKL